MRITVQRVEAPFHFVATNAAGIAVHMDTGDAPKGAGPVQMLVMALGGCSGIDIVDILEKGRQRLDTLDMALDYERARDQTPAVITKIHAHYDLTGDLDPDKVRRAIELSLDKYCTVSKMLKKTVALTFSFSVNGTRYEGRTA
jgi:putative redox protein